MIQTGVLQDAQNKKQWQNCKIRIKKFQAGIILIIIRKVQRVNKTFLT